MTSLALYHAVAVGARLALDLAALAILACCLHLHRVQSVPLRVAELALGATAAAGIVAASAFVEDLALASVAVLVVLGAVVAPTAALSTTRS